MFSGLGPRARALFSDIKGPWGPPGDGEPGDGGDPKGSGPWGQEPKRKRADRWRSAQCHFARRVPAQGAGPFRRKRRRIYRRAEQQS